MAAARVDNNAGSAPRNLETFGTARTLFNDLLDPTTSSGFSIGVGDTVLSDTGIPFNVVGIVYGNPDGDIHVVVI